MRDNSDDWKTGGGKMNKKISLGATISLMALTAAVAVTITAFCVMGSLNVSISDYSQRASMFQKLTTVDSLVRSNYIGKVDETNLDDGMISGYVNSIGDKYGCYLDAADYKTIKLSNGGISVGIGVNVVKNADGNIKVASVLSGSPAQKEGIKVNDVITTIAGENVAAIGYTDGVNKLKGSVGTTAVFTVQRGGKSLTFSIVRKSFSVSTVSSKLIGNLGYVRILEFDAGTPTEFSSQVDSLIAKGAKGLVFDVRNNPGGLLESVEQMIDKLVPKGPIVRAKYRDGVIRVLKYSDANEIKLPMAVLTNQNTASAAELFTAALKDYGKAKSIGTKTYGKGTMQKIYDLSDGTALDLSIAYFYPPKSDNFEGKGVSPDITVAMSTKDEQNLSTLSIDNDNQIMSAISYLEMKIR
jgi:carboxyl-terminal processing protease